MKKQGGRKQQVHTSTSRIDNKTIEKNTLKKPGTENGNHARIGVNRDCSNTCFGEDRLMKSFDN